MKHHGFTLIEVVVGVALAGMVSIVLFNSFFQSNRTLALVEEYVDADTVSTIVLHQLERDVMGAMIPQMQPKSSSAKAWEGQGKAKVPLTKVFYAAQKNNQLDLLTFLTVNPLSRATTDKPRLVRVAYRLKENKERKGLFMLTRQETHNLDFTIIEKTDKERPRELVISDMIKQCSMEFLYTVTPAQKEESKQEAPKKEAKKNEKPVPRILKRDAAWDSDKQEDQKPVIPAMIKLNLTIADTTEKMERSIEYHLPIYSSSYAQNAQEILAIRKAQQPQEPTIVGIPEREFKSAIGDVKKTLESSKRTQRSFSEMLMRGNR